MTKNLKIFWIFYIKLLIPAVLFSLLITFMTNFNIENFGLCFLLILPALHYFIYELRLKDEYYFYAHFGFSRSFLWGMTVAISLIIKIIAYFL
ncbi:hypothetical protein CHRYSEOSP005_25950 [Chryseobacterium sp. Alg-005]